MRIAIITLLDEKNYGNRWQAYAMNSLLNELKIETENIYFWERNAPRKCLRERIKRILPIKVAYVLHMFSVYEINNFSMLKRVIKFIRFNKKYMSSRLLLVNSFEDISSRLKLDYYDYFVTGSDQVWNPYYVANPIYFLQFAKAEKRLAFMASFGCKEIPSDKFEQYKKWLMGMNYISVREDDGADIVRNITGKSVDVFFDPTLLLSKDNWKQIERKPKKVKLPDKYAVSFMFGNAIKEIKEFCFNNNIELIYLNNKKDKRLFSVDPAEMLYIISHSAIVFTDSFHVMALSIRYNRQFYVFKREGFEYMFNRLESTLNRLQLGQCIYKETEVLNLKPIEDMEYERINEVLEIEKNNFFEHVNNIVYMGN